MVTTFLSSLKCDENFPATKIWEELKLISIKPHTKRLLNFAVVNSIQLKITAPIPELI